MRSIAQVVEEHRGGMGRSGSGRGVQSDPRFGLPVPPDPKEPGNDLLELWYLLLRRNWFRLGVVSPDDRQKAWRLTSGLVTVANSHGRVVRAINALELDMSRAAAIADAVLPREEAMFGDPPRFVVAIDSPVDNPHAIRVLTACDAVVVAMELGVTSIPRTRRAIEIIGRDRIVGAVLLQE